MLELNNLKATILDKTQLTENHIVFLTVDYGKLPSNKITEHLANIKNSLAKDFHPATLIISTNTSIELFEKKDLTKIELNQYETKSI